MTIPSHKRRARQDIIFEILQTVENGAKKTHVIRKVGLSFHLCEQYLNALEKGSFITYRNGVWKITEKGLHALEVCTICRRLFGAG